MRDFLVALMSAYLSGVCIHFVTITTAQKQVTANGLWMVFTWPWYLAEMFYEEWIYTPTAKPELMEYTKELMSLLDRSRDLWPGYEICFKLEPVNSDMVLLRTVFHSFDNADSKYRLTVPIDTELMKQTSIEVAAERMCQKIQMVLASGEALMDDDDADDGED